MRLLVRLIGVALLEAIILGVIGYGAEAPDGAAFDSVLKRYVLDDGTVKYAALKAGLDPLTRFVQQTGALSPVPHASLFPTPRAQIGVRAKYVQCARAFWQCRKNIRQKRSLERSYRPVSVFYENEI